MILIFISVFLLTKPYTMKRTLFLLIAFFFLAIQAEAQKTVDVLVLKNGSIIKGKIIENTAEVVKIETCCGNIFAYRSDEILETRSEKFQSKSALKEKGFFNLTSAGILIGSGKNEKQAPFSLLVECNYRFNNYFALGGVSGLEFLNEATLPLAVDLKGMLPLSKGTTLFLGTTTGYAFSLEEPEELYYVVKNAKGGFLLNPEVGFITTSESNVRFFMAIGYRYSELNYERESWYGADNIERQVTYNRFSIRVGLCLN